METSNYCVLIVTEAVIWDRVVGKAFPINLNKWEDPTRWILGKKKTFQKEETGSAKALRQERSGVWKGLWLQYSKGEEKVIKITVKFLVIILRSTGSQERLKKNNLIQLIFSKSDDLESSGRMWAGFENGNTQDLHMAWKWSVQMSEDSGTPPDVRSGGRDSVREDDRYYFLKANKWTQMQWRNAFQLKVMCLGWMEGTRVDQDFRQRVKERLNSGSQVPPRIGVDEL